MEENKGMGRVRAEGSIGPLGFCVPIAAILGRL